MTTKPNCLTRGGGLKRAGVLRTAGGSDTVTPFSSMPRLAVRTRLRQHQQPCGPRLPDGPG
jgi:hypothetical protein